MVRDGVKEVVPFSQGKADRLGSELINHFATLKSSLDETKKGLDETKKSLNETNKKADQQEEAQKHLADRLASVEKQQKNDAADMIQERARRKSMDKAVRFGTTSPPRPHHARHSALHPAHTTLPHPK